MMNTTMKLNKKERASLRTELREYMRTIGDLTAEEEAELRDWVADGHGVYSNPNFIYSESGNIMDFITGCRCNADMCENHFDGLPDESEPLDHDWDDDESPF